MIVAQKWIVMTSMIKLHNTSHLKTDGHVDITRLLLDRAPSTMSNLQLMLYVLDKSRDSPLKLVIVTPQSKRGARRT